MDIKRNEATVNRPDGDRIIDAPYVMAHLPSFIEQIKKEKAWKKNDRNGITVFKSTSLTVVVTALQAEAEIAYKEVDAFMTMEVLSGAGKVTTPDGDLDLSEGDFVAFHPGMSPVISAVEDLIVLTTVYQKVQD